MNTLGFEPKQLSLLEDKGDLESNAITNSAMCPRVTSIADSFFRRRLGTQHFSAVWPSTGTYVDPS